VQFYRGLSALENLEFLISLRSQVPDGRASEMLHRVGLSDRADDLVGSFSSGMVQRMRLAAALVHAPDVVLFDEPYSNLDLAGSELVSSIVDDIVAGGGAVLVATNRDDVAAWCSRTLRISDYTKVVAV
jgi:ABC-type multidrug transport system ATPase subunit